MTVWSPFCPPHRENRPPTHPEPLRHLGRTPLERVRVDVPLGAPLDGRKAEDPAILDPIGLLAESDQVPAADQDVPSDSPPLSVERGFPVPCSIKSSTTEPQDRWRAAP